MRRSAIGMMYEMSRAMAVSEKIAFTATGEARPNKPGKMLKIVVNQMARRGVCVDLET